VGSRYGHARTATDWKNGYWLPVLYTQPELLLMLTLTLTCVAWYSGRRL